MCVLRLCVNMCERSQLSSCVLRSRDRRAFGSDMYEKTDWWQNTLRTALIVQTGQLLIRVREQQWQTLPIYTTETIMGLTNDPINGLSLFTFPVISETHEAQTKNIMSTCGHHFSFTFLKIKCHKMLFYKQVIYSLHPCLLESMFYTAVNDAGKYNLTR